MKSHDIQAAVTNAERVTLEIGPGMYPLPACADRFGFSPHNIYVGWNVDSYQHRVVSEDLFGVFDDVPARLPGVYCICLPHTPDIEIRLRDFVPEATADTVIMGNVLGEGKVSAHYRGHRRINPTGYDYHGATSFEQKKQTLAIAQRSLKPGGVLAIYETETPAILGRILPKEVVPIRHFYDVALSAMELICHQERSEDPERFTQLLSRFSSIPTENRRMGRYSYLQLYRKPASA